MTIKAATKRLLVAVLGERGFLDLSLWTGRLSKNAYYDELTRIVLRRVLTPTSTCVDVGCHQGSILKMMMTYAPAGTFFAFEPLPHLYQELKSRFQKPNVHIYDCALSEAPGMASFAYVVTNPGYSGLKRRPYDRPNEQVVEISVRTEQLDALIERENVARVALIKIDVEGGEYGVLKGAQSLLRRDSPVIVFEHGRGAMAAYGKNPEQLYDLLTTDCGLSVSLLQDWLADKPPLDIAGFCREVYGNRNYYFMAHPPTRLSPGRGQGSNMAG